ncbi:MAG: ATP-binding cassette domain-containing protein, partial [Clostridiales bacterium]|nr:ATP-binding cassette domain-containing protein [Clostridiales bacterium]
MGGIYKVPVMMQMEMTECGAASLGMILAYHGKWLTLEQLREDCGVSRDGSNAVNIIEAARNYGLRANGYRFETSDLKKLDRPAIIHWNFNHFVVLDGFRGGKAVINDPARGCVTVSEKELDDAFTGVTLLFEPEPDFRQEGKPKSVLKFVFSRLKGAVGIFVFGGIAAAVSAFAGLVMPVFGGIFADEILSGKNYGWLLWFTLAYGIALFVQVGITAVQNLYFNKVNARFAVIGNSEFLWHVLRLPMKFFSNRYAGDIASRQNLNEVIARTMIRQLAPVVVDVFMLVFYLLMMINYSMPLTIVAVCATLMNIAAGAYSATRLMNAGRVYERSDGKYFGALTSGIEMIETIKATGSELAFTERLSGHYTSKHNARMESIRFEQVFGIIPGLIQRISGLAIWLVAVVFIIQGNFTVGMFIAFQGFLSGFNAPVSKFRELLQQIISVRVQMERVDDVFRYEPDAVSTEGYKGEGKLIGEVELKNITFGYSKLAAPFVKDFSVSISSGKVVAFVGASGCGKSTLAKLITGLYEPWNGEILFDGKPLKEIDKDVFRSSVVMIDQDITLFQDTVANNIKMW